MAERPVFIPSPDRARLVEECPITFFWHRGMSLSQQKKNISSLHKAAADRGLIPLLEISTKSDDEIGRRMSAFSLSVNICGNKIPLESAFQGSKVFKNGGPYQDLYGESPRTAKSDMRLRGSGPLIGFSLFNEIFPITPRTAFYDWLYISALYPHVEYLSKKILHYKGFTDIAFNPAKSLNCQAKSCALLIAMLKKGVIDEAMLSFENFVEVLSASKEYSLENGRMKQISFVH